MSVSETRHDSDALRDAAEQTVPSSEFSAEALRKAVERTVQERTPEATPGQYLRATASDTDSRTDTSSGVAALDDVSKIPAQHRHTTESGAPRFSLESRIGSGATSSVYAIRDTCLDRIIALKVLKHTRHAWRKVASRFLHEARVTARLEHPNIMPIHDIGQDDKSRLFFAMKNVEGHSVGDAIRAAREGQAPVAGFHDVGEKLEIFFKLCDAIGFAHEQGFIHQDIKPDNVMLGRHGEVLLLDWGCALDLSATAEADTKAIYGTPAYMSPEQARREAADERSDIYCLGATFFHMLTLCHPAWADDPEEFWEMKQKGDLSPLPEEAVGRAPALLLDICRTAMAPEPSQRYQTVAQLREAVREYQAHAESIALTHEARLRLKRAVAQADYDQFSEVTHDLRQALRMWPQNTEASRAASETQRAYARCALDRRDLQLAQSIVGTDPAFDDIRVRLRRLQEELATRQQRIRWLKTAAALLGLAVLSFLAYLAVDYFRYFGSWRTVYHWRSSDGAPQGLSRTINAHSPLVTAPDNVLFDSTVLRMERAHTMWFDDVRVRDDVRLEVQVMWPDSIDGFEMHIQSRRESPPEWWMCLAGFSCQFGGNAGQDNFMSRNDVPGSPSTGNRVAADFKTGTWYCLAFERRGENVTMYVDGKNVYSQAELLPLPGKGFESIAIRSWGGSHVRALTVRRMALPRKASPLVVGDAAITRGDYADAVEQYLRLSDDFPDGAIAEQALAKATLATDLLGDAADSLRYELNRRMRVQFPESHYWPLLRQSECLSAWKAGDCSRSLAILTDVMDQDPETRLALRLLSSYDQNVLPDSILSPLLTCVGRTTRAGRLYLRGMGIRSLEPLRGMNLTQLDIADNDIASLEPLRDMRLEDLDIRANLVEDLSPLAGMPLARLNIESNAIRSLEPLRGMRLARLDAGGNHVRDLSPLSGMPLNHLAIEMNHVETLEPLRGLPLSLLECSFNPIASLGPLRGMPLRALRCRQTKVSDLAPLGGMPLAELELSNTNVSSLSAPAECTTLVSLKISRTRVSDMSPVANLQLTTFEARATPIGSIEPLRGMPLGRLCVDSTLVATLEPVRGMQLTNLAVGWTPISDLSPVDVSRLSDLILAGSRVADISPLRERLLTALDIQHTLVCDLSALSANPPRALRFTMASFDAGHLRSVVRQWRRAGHTRQAYLLEAKLATEQGDIAAARELALRHAGHRYLPVQLGGPFEDADSIAKSLGGHLITVTSREEFLFAGVVQQDYAVYNVWLALPPTGHPDRWLTGEALTYRIFKQVARADDTVHWYQFLGGNPGWFHDHCDAVEGSLIVEWDD